MKVGAAIIAPRALLLQTGHTDLWSDPKGEFLSAVTAAPVYQLLGKQALYTDQLAASGQPIFHTMGFVMHAGGHGTVPADWDLFQNVWECTSKKLLCRCAERVDGRGGSHPHLTIGYSWSGEYFFAEIAG